MGYLSKWPLTMITQGLIYLETIVVEFPEQPNYSGIPGVEVGRIDYEKFETIAQDLSFTIDYSNNRTIRDTNEAVYEGHQTVLYYGKRVEGSGAYRLPPSSIS
jgi:hypothetical protein